jgi:hypothetical protein
VLIQRNQQLQLLHAQAGQQGVYRLLHDSLK